jgi:hypothetical protein
MVHSDRAIKKLMWTGFVARIGKKQFVQKYLKVQFLPYRKHNSSPLQRSVGELS